MSASFSVAFSLYAEYPFVDRAVYEVYGLDQVEDYLLLNTLIIMFYGGVSKGRLHQGGP